MTRNIWGYQATPGHQAGTDLTGYKVEAIDGNIGNVDKHSEDAGSAYIVVDTGVWIFGRHVLLPVGTITTVDATDEKIYLARTKDDYQGSPEFDKDKHTAQVADDYEQPAPLTE
ncbi:PRC-barrel domain-containing protein [Streptomyces sp. NPDC004647]|uniref:PRC-barrel domain-containing protein n=1 Tax=Streptomyces sp. NPDC004647 TaxID=3154671 RepID=UPI0033BE6387